MAAELPADSRGVRAFNRTDERQQSKAPVGKHRQRENCMSKSRFACSMALAMFVASAPAFADIVFTDGTFDPANYTEVGPYLSNATMSASQCATCGNPGSALEIMVSILAGAELPLRGL
jgi:hypothetical protein